MGFSFVVVDGGGGRRRRSNQTPGEQPTFRERVNALRYVPKLVRLVWETHRRYTITIAALRLVRAFIPIATLWVGKLIIDGVVAAQRDGASWHAVGSLDRKSTRLNSSHLVISYAVVCLK